MIFAGPPYALDVINEIPDIIFDKNLLKEGGQFVLETSPKHDFTEHPKLLEVRNYGQTHFWFFGHEVEDDDDEAVNE